MKRIAQLALLFLLIFSLTQGQKLYATENYQPRVYTQDQLDVQATFDGLSANDDFKTWLLNDDKLRSDFDSIIKIVDTTIIVKFIVERDATITNIEVVGSPLREFADSIASKLRSSTLWRSGEISSVKVRTAINFWLRSRYDENIPCMYIENPPSFKGGDIFDFRHWVMLKIKYPEKAVAEGPSEGRVVAYFTIERDGSLDEIVIIKSPGVAFSKELERVLRLSPRWTPATTRNKQIKVRMTIPIDFSKEPIKNINNNKKPRKNVSM